MHRFIPPIGATSAPSIDPVHTEAIKRWTREALRLAEDDVVTVSEIACVDPGCPLVETAIVIFGDEAAKTRRWRFTRPRVAVTKMMVQQALEASSGLALA